MIVLLIERMTSYIMTGHNSMNLLQLFYQIMHKEAKTVDARTGELLRYDDLLKATIDVDFVVRLERKNDVHTISNKTTINQLMQDGYQESKDDFSRLYPTLSGF